ncbi:hypothetical protein EWF20_12930 [Sulfolobus sp. S-194]|uniref:hypothetical protein n=1 Tax=Sulfolobus sp. S-194 TaxID=2512240 RepID=UPI001436EB3A|nr:hypothetical protein [Sulfolobus sp. S-194]QIW24942.1 hypothetical protein EWF20_12930 [Sulfolobus sp. S-194]
MDIPLQILVLIFLISFITNILPFAGAPYTLIATNFLLAYGENIENILIVIFLSGTGAALAKTITYILGIILKKPLRKNKNIPLINKFIKSKYFPLALFITAILPGLPLDDYLYIGGGLVKESLKKMLIITIPSKILKSLIEIPLELFGILKISDLFNLNPLLLSILLTLIFFIIGFLLIKIDWNTLYEKISEKYLNKRI